ncbi:MAG: hypothetical protein ACI84R_003487 [Candidatus Azotimanducaceae bacterium]|jgi:hypothetical protein
MGLIAYFQFVVAEKKIRQPYPKNPTKYHTTKIDRDGALKSGDQYFSVF